MVLIKTNGLAKFPAITWVYSNHLVIVPTICCKMANISEMYFIFNTSHMHLTFHDVAQLCQKLFPIFFSEAIEFLSSQENVFLIDCSN